MYKITSLLLLIYVAMIDCSDTSEEYHLTQRKDLSMNYITVENLRLEHGKEYDSIVS